MLCLLPGTSAVPGDVPGHDVGAVSGIRWAEHRGAAGCPAVLGTDPGGQRGEAELEAPAVTRGGVADRPVFPAPGHGCIVLVL